MVAPSKNMAIIKCINFYNFFGHYVVCILGEIVSTLPFICIDFFILCGVGFEKKNQFLYFLLSMLTNQGPIQTRFLFLLAFSMNIGVLEAKPIHSKKGWEHFVLS